MKLLAIGSVVKLNGGERKLMITSRTPLVNENGIIGYYDYGACLYPYGQIDQQLYFFNDKDIAEVYFEGYCDEMEIKYREKYQEEIKDIKYPKLMVKE